MFTRISRATTLALCIGLAPLALAPLALAPAALAGETPSPEGARVYFIDLKDGDTVSSPLLVRFGLSGMGVAPAGTEMENTGHHHLLIDTVIDGEEIDQPIFANANHIHFGGGQTEATIELSQGEHTLQLVLGDWSHIPHDPPVLSERISITVK